jgi:hypothetical protein
MFEHIEQRPLKGLLMYGHEAQIMAHFQSEGDAVGCQALLPLDHKGFQKCLEILRFAGQS